ncbi:hypothetical protein ACFQY9_24130 [Microvirga aerilata]|uniref:hypothetical protein n=1 Tax=Microvirga aerilata TaxID=670292 RepID=UPI0036298A52
MRHILHPGPAAPERVTTALGAPVPLRFALEPGDAVEEAIARGWPPRAALAVSFPCGAAAVSRSAM